MKSLFSSILICSFVGSSFGQITGGPVNTLPQSPGVVDGVYMKTDVPTKRMIPYEPVREADVMWSKRCWRTIDMREKLNHPIYYPNDDIDVQGNWVKNTTKWSLFTIIKHHVLLGDLVVYAPYSPTDFGLFDGDLFKYPVFEKNGKNYYNDSLFKDQIFFFLGSINSDPNAKPLTNVYGEDSSIMDPVTGIMTFKYPPADSTWVKSKEVLQYHIKEDWFFDKERSLLDVRILGIAPVREEKMNGVVSGYKEMFWLYFPDCRPYFNNYFYYNTSNDAQWMSFDDMFWKRQFTSTIYKEENVYDRKIESFRFGVDALRESEKISNGIRNFEHDVWSF